LFIFLINFTFLFTCFIKKWGTRRHLAESKVIGNLNVERRQSMIYLFIFLFTQSTDVSKSNCSSFEYELILCEFASDWSCRKFRVGKKGNTRFSNLSIKVKMPHQYLMRCLIYSSLDSKLLLLNSSYHFEHHFVGCKSISIYLLALIFMCLPFPFHFLLNELSRYLFIYFHRSIFSSNEWKNLLLAKKGSK
jgi:hypothetical protein